MPGISIQGSVGIPTHPADTCQVLTGPRRVLRDTVQGVEVTRGGKLSVWFATLLGGAVCAGLTPSSEHNFVTVVAFGITGGLGGALLGVLLVAALMWLTPWKLKLHWASYAEKTNLTQGWVPHTWLYLMSNCQHSVKDLTCKITSLEGVEYQAEPRIADSTPVGTGMLRRGKRVSVGYPTDFGANRAETDNPASDEYEIVWTSRTESGDGPVVISTMKWIVERDPTP